MIRSTKLDADYWLGERAAAEEHQQIRAAIQATYKPGDTIHHKDGTVGIINDIRTGNIMVSLPGSTPMIPFEDILRDWTPA